MKNIKKKHIAGVVVAYNSGVDEILENIDTYVHQIDFLFVVDNSETENHDLKIVLSSSNNIHYIWMGGNYGIACALNTAAEAATKRNYEYLLMMDNDSKLLKGSIGAMTEFFNKGNIDDRVALMCTQADKNLVSNTISDEWYVITSGSLLRLDAYIKCGPFLDCLFIDGIDHEYCYRLKKFGYRIVSLNYIYMPHNLGETKVIYLFGNKLFSWSAHSPIRNYYLLRNFLYVLNLYKNFLPTNIKNRVFYGVFKACLLDLLMGGQFLTRLQHLFLAVKHYKENRLGKFSGKRDYYE